MSEGNSSKVMDFYRGSTVLITGASGFVGKVLLEKILRCLEVDKVYVMIRPKKNLSSEMRLKRILGGSLFARIRENPLTARELTDKVIPVEVDLENKGEVIAGDLSSKLREEVEVVFNLLASVSFNEPLDCALKTNVEYTDRVLTLVSQMKRLKVVIHVSTFYSNCDKSFIEERIYDDIGFGGYANISNIVSKLNDAEKQIMTPYIIGNFPNTYTFSKKCAEVLIRDKYGSLPIGIFRPPIVTSTYHEPVPGWIDNFNGPSGLVVPLSEGMYSAALCDTQVHPFIVPVDFCVNALLTCAVDVYFHHSYHPEILVYNYIDSTCTMSWKQIADRMFQGLTPVKRFLATYVTATVTRNRLRYALCTRIMRLQGYVLDAVRRARGQNPVMGQIFAKMIALSEVLLFFSFNEWQTGNENVHRMLLETSAIEASLFPCDLTKVNWDEYYRNFVPGVVKYAIGPRKTRYAEKEQQGAKRNSASFYLVWNCIFRNLVILFKFIFGNR